jgi:hypothetical protein
MPVALRTSVEAMRASPMSVTTIISGGQTGADRGGLEAAMALGLAHGGCCPRGRRAEDGVVPARYRLVEDDTSAYWSRTRRNVLAADATVVFTRGAPRGGSRLTIVFAEQAQRPWLHLELDHVATTPAAAAKRLRAWLAANRVRVLNVAGERESTAPGIAATVERFLRRALG